MRTVNIWNVIFVSRKPLIDPFGKALLNKIWANVIPQIEVDIKLIYTGAPLIRNAVGGYISQTVKGVDVYYE